jgi:hypothetical protein
MNRTVYETAHALLFLAIGLLFLVNHDTAGVFGCLILARLGPR